MTIPQYKIPDTLSITDLNISDLKYAYTQLSKNGSSNDINQSFRLPLPDSLLYNSEYKWSAEETHQILTQGIDMVSGGLGIEDQMNKSSSNYKSAAEKMALAYVSKATKDFMSSKLNASNSDAVYKYATKKLGLAYNPNEQLYFDGVSLRDFDMEFSLTPMSRADADKIKKFVISLHQDCAPSLEYSGYFFTYPDFYNINVVVDGTSILKRKNLAITSIMCNLNPDGPLTWHDGGFPTSLHITIAFKETAIPTKENLSNISLLGGSL